MSPEAGATDPKPKTGSTLAAEKVLAPSLLGRVMTALALGVQGLGLLGLALAVIAFLIGIVVLGPAQIFAATVDEIWFYTNPYSLDLFQVFIERNLFFWLPTPTDPWFNVIRPLLFLRPVTIGLAAVILFAVGRILRRMSRRL